MTGQYGGCNYSDECTHAVGGICLLQTIILNVRSSIGTRDKYVSFCHETLAYLCFGANTSVRKQCCVTTSAVVQMEYQKMFCWHYCFIFSP